jgi:hypothetical protein
MKKFLSVLIPVILLTATAGVYVVNHYCMITGKTTANISCCSRCSDDCCKKDVKVVRLSFESVKHSESKILSVFDFIPMFTSAISIRFSGMILPAGTLTESSLSSEVPEILRTTVLRI